MSISRYRFEQKNLHLWHKIVRLELAGLDAPAIARLCKRSRRKIDRTLSDPWYQEWRQARVEQRTSILDRSLAKDTQVIQDGLAELIPLAIRTYEYALSHVGENIAAGVKAADAVLDRDTRFSKQSTSVVEHRIQQSEIDRARELARQLRPTAIQALPAVESDRTIAGEIVEEACSKDTLEATIALKSEQKT